MTTVSPAALSTPRFLQIHMLTSFPASLLNRDDAGLAKRIPFGGVIRTRISSQCLKRHWRMADDPYALSTIDADLSVRSRQTFEHKLYRPLLAANPSLDESLAEAVSVALMKKVLGQDGENDKNALHTKQVTVLGPAEMRFLLTLAQKVIDTKPTLDSKKRLDAKVIDAIFDKKAEENLRGLTRAAGLDAALFGRMVTSDILSRGDAAIHVAHAFTTHGEYTEADYFSALDDLQVNERGEATLGSGHINSTELTTGLFYTYAVVDMPLLIKNLGEQTADNARALTQKVVEHVIHLMATVSPGAKLGATAPYANAHLVLVESGRTQPRTLANAFLEPSKASYQESLLLNTYEKLGAYLQESDAVYGKTTERQWLALQAKKAETLHKALGVAPTSLDAVAQWAATQVKHVVL